MPLLDIAVLVGVVRLDLLALRAVVSQQRLVTLGEIFALRQVVDGGAQPIRAVPLRHAAQFPDGVLITLTQALETLREADRHRLPVRVCQHEVVQQVVERLALDRHAQFVHVREIRGRQPARLMHLAKEHFLGRSLQGAPTPHLPLQRPQLPVGKPARVAALEVGEQGLGLQPRLLLQQRCHFRPDLGERIDTRRPVMGPGDFAG